MYWFSWLRPALRGRCAKALRKGAVPPGAADNLTLLRSPEASGKETLSAGNWSVQNRAHDGARVDYNGGCRSCRSAIRPGSSRSMETSLTIHLPAHARRGVGAAGALSSKNHTPWWGRAGRLVTMIMVEPVLAMTFILGALKAKSLAIDASMASSLTRRLRILDVCSCSSSS